MSIVEYAALQATRAFDRSDNLFNTAGFQSAMARLTESRPMMTPQVAEAVLLSSPAILRDGRSHWRLKP